MTNTVFSNWSVIRIVRLIIGIVIIIQAIDIQNYWIILPGIIFTVMALFNAGCGSAGCALPSKRK